MATRRLLLLIVWLAPPSYPQSLRDVLGEAEQFVRSGKTNQAMPLLETALAEARKTQDHWAEAESLRLTGVVLSRQGKYAEARAELNRSLEIFTNIGNRLGAGKIYNSMAFLEGVADNRAKEREYYLKALAELDAAGETGLKAGIYYNLVATTEDLTEKEKMIQDGLASVGSSRMLEGLLYMRWGEALFSRGNYTDATVRLEQSISVLENASAQRELASALASLARVYRAHGMPEKSLELNQRALAIHERGGDPVMVIQSLNAVSAAYHQLGRQTEELEYAERALAAARKAGIARYIRRQLLEVANIYYSRGDYAKAARMIEERMTAGGADDEVPWRTLALSYLALKDPRAPAAAERAVETNRRRLPEFLPASLHARALIRAETGELDGALEDVREGLDIIEKQRLNAVATDAMKRGFAEQNKGLFSIAVDVLFRLGRHSEAVETAERARGRAFLDLLASRDALLKPRDQEQLAALRGIERELHATSMQPAKAWPPAGSPLLTRSVEPPVAALWRSWQSADPGLRSFVAAEPFSAAQLAVAAARLQSTLVAYWVNANGLYIWVVKPGGGVDGVRVDVTRAQLEKAIGEALGWPGAGRMRGEVGPAVAMRGGEAVSLSAMDKAPWRRLHQWLVKPVRHLLPNESGSLLTIVPHGPLFHVSFAALMDETGRYFVERYRLHHVPAGAVLELTKSRRRVSREGPAKFLVVADPAPMAGPDGKALPALPGSRREASAISSLQPSVVTVLAGRKADERVVQSAVAGKSVVHFATHGILRQDDPFESFLALGGPAQGVAYDGRLTAAEIYQLDLDADLVVLSACRSALGKISLDGMIGLTRAFFYAGAPSVMSTLWDVADEPTSRMVESFYRNYKRHGGKSRALREAQLRLISDLRNGRVRVPTALGPLTVPEHPVFWAGFVLAGEP